MSDLPNNLFTNLQGSQNTNLMSASNNPLFNNNSTTHKGLFWLVKLTLMFINAFTGMIGIFIVLFGFAYPEERFPGDLKGKNCALLSIVYIGWTLIGYCGAHHQKFSFLLIYSGLVVFYMFTNIIIFGVLAPKYQWLDANLFWIMCGYFTILLVFALLLAYQIRLKEEHNNYNDDYNLTYSMNPNINYGSNSQYVNPSGQTILFNNLDNINNMYNMPNYSNQFTNLDSGGSIVNCNLNQVNLNNNSLSNYFQKNWQRINSKRNFFRSNCQNNNLISTEIKQVDNINSY